MVSPHLGPWSPNRPQGLRGAGAKGPCSAGGGPTAPWGDLWSTDLVCGGVQDGGVGSVNVLRAAVRVPP